MKLNTRKIRQSKNAQLQMLTCYDYQTARLLNETTLDLILVGDSVGNVVLGYDHTVSVTLDEMIIFCSAVKRGAPDKFVIGDLPFGTYATIDQGIKSSINLFQKSKVEALKLEGASETNCQLIKRLTEIGIPVMGHIGLVPQSVHEMGGYYVHGKTKSDGNRLIDEAIRLQEAGAFGIVLECVEESIAQEITSKLKVPTIGIGSGEVTDGQVLVLNDLLKMGPRTPPKFCKPIADLYSLKKNLIEKYLNGYKQDPSYESLRQH